MNPILYAIPVFLLTMVIEWCIGRWRGRDLYVMADAITSLQMGLLSQLASVFMAVFTVGMYAMMYAHYRLTSWPIESWWVWPLALLFYDFLYYWVHRCGHEINLMWAAHQVHHSSEYFNLSTALRQSSTTPLWSWPFYLPMAVIGIPPLVFVTVALIDLLYQYWVHTELIGKLGWFDRIFVSPSNHRVHHGQNDYCLDKNYGGILIVWDRLFGTFVEERDDEHIIYGVRKPLASFDPIWGNLNTYADLWRASRSPQNEHRNMRLWFAAPSSQSSATAPFDLARFQRFQSPASASRQYYVLIHYVVLIVAICHFLYVETTLPIVAQIIYALLLAFSTFCLGGLLQGYRYARIFEQMRLLLFVGFVLQSHWFSTPLHWTIVVFVVILHAVSWGWLSTVSRSPPNV